MKVALVSDSHDNKSAILRFVERVREAKPELIIHCGDYISPFTARFFKGAGIKLVGVLGNNDGDRNHLIATYRELLNAEIDAYVRFLRIEDKVLAVHHGHDQGLLNDLLSLNSVDVVVHGHTHNYEVKREGDKLVINPGELCGYLSGESTFALLDVRTLKVEFVFL